MCHSRQVTSILDMFSVLPLVLCERVGGIYDGRSQGKQQADRSRCERGLVRCADLQILVHSNSVKGRRKKWRRACSAVRRSGSGTAL